MGIIIDSDVMGSTISTVVDCMFIFGIIMFVGSFIAIPVSIFVHFSIVFIIDIADIFEILNTCLIQQIVLICRYRKRQGCFGDTATIHYPTLQSRTIFLN